MDRQRRLRALSRRVPAIALVAAAAPFVASGRPADSGRPSQTERPAPPVSPSLHTSRVFVANRGKLVGAFSGFAWVVGSDGVHVDTPNPCNERGCFRGVDGTLCAQGTLPTSSCNGPPSPDGRCRRDAWAVKLGLDTRRDGGPWGSLAKPYVAISYLGAEHMRLAAHRAGDGPTEYCVDDYISGDLVRAERFRAECWHEGGATLRDFEAVDKFILELPASDAAATFDYCITAIYVAGPIEAAAGE
jgi:hypothetical protein